MKLSLIRNISRLKQITLSRASHLMLCTLGCKYKIFRERAPLADRDQKMRTSGECGRDLLYCKPHHATKFQAVICKFLNFIWPTPFMKNSKFCGTPKICRAWPLLVASCFMVLCIISLNFRPIAEFLKESEW